MLNSNHNHSSCEFAEQTIAYLYGESNADEKIKFEAHLVNCAVCAEELTGFGFVRSSILEWREADFSNSKIPAFDVPVKTQEKSFSAKLQNSGSWFGELWKGFAFNPVSAGAVLAALVICAGLILFALNFSASNEIAKKSNDENAIVTTTASSTPVASIKEESRSNIGNNGGGKSAADKTSNSPAENGIEIRTSLSEKQVAPKNTVIKISVNPPKNNLGNSVRSSKNANGDAKKTSTVRRKQVPNLIDAEDEEDDSIRLADLFAEVGTK